MNRILAFGRHGLILCAALAVLAWNSVSLVREFHRTFQKRRAHPYVFLGDQFPALRDVLAGTEKIGYCTDQSLDVRRHAMQFSQAQYALAPVILEFNNPDHPFVILDYADPAGAARTIAKEGLIPLRRSPLGPVLAQNPRFITGARR